jgi:hypothetical protein
VKVRTLWKKLIRGEDKLIHYIIALNKWFFDDGNRHVKIKEFSEYCNRSVGSTRSALNQLDEKYNLLNKTLIEGTYIFTPRTNHYQKIPLKEIFEQHFQHLNSD